MNYFVNYLIYYFKKIVHCNKSYFINHHINNNK